MKIESETITLNELRSFLGKDVEIIVLDCSEDLTAGRMDSLWAAAGKDLVDPKAYVELREASRI